MASAYVSATTEDSITVSATADSAATDHKICWYYGIGSYPYRDGLHCDGTHTTYTSPTTRLAGGTYQIAVEFWIDGETTPYNTVYPPNVTITGAAASTTNVSITGETSTTHYHFTLNLIIMEHFTILMCI